MSLPPEPGASPLVWTEDGRPHSRLYDDVYFSAVDGLEESRAVFLQGCDLPNGWNGRSRFVVGELGFGTGLNILALLDLWRTTRSPNGRLHIFSIEAHPLSSAEAARALSAWPEIADLSRRLIENWPGKARGFHRVEFPELNVILDVAIMEAADALEQWGGRANAWFLDGFSPALNPAMWRDEVLTLVAQRSAPGARAATFSVAGAVRRGLAAAGFSIEKKPGFGRKRERLEASLSGEPGPTPVRRMAVIGAGIAGCATVRAAKRLGADVELFEAVAVGAGASGNPAALVTPRLDAGGGPGAKLFAQALRRAAQIYQAHPAGVIAHGVVQAATSDRDTARFAKIVASDLFETGSITPLDASDLAAKLDDTSTASGLAMHEALVVEPAAFLSAWVSAPRRETVSSVTQADNGAWRLLDDAGRLIGEFDAVIVAAGPSSAALIEGASLRAVRGQVSWLEDASRPQASAWGGYAAPTRTGFIFGATHDRDDTQSDLRETDHARNLESLAAGRPCLAAIVAERALSGRASIRATTSDHLPLAGAAAGAPPGLFLLTGLGGRGFATAPLLGEHVAALAMAAPSPVPNAVAEILDPARFARRAARRGGS